MIVKILKSSASFPGVKYNHEKMRSGKGELLKVKNFGSLGLSRKPGPQDYINYLKAVSATNKRISKPQLHALISAKGKNISKLELCDTAEKWLSLMGYGHNPYLIIFHKDTGNNHVHIVSSRVDKNGKKISSAFERIRAVKVLSGIVDSPKADIKTLNKIIQYQYSTSAQMRTLLECSGFKAEFKDNMLLVSVSGKTVRELKLTDIENKCKGYVADKKRCKQLNAIFIKILEPGLTKGYDFLEAGSTRDRLEAFAHFVRKRTGAELVFHSKEERPPYGYTIIDHASRCIMKGSEVMKLQHILNRLELSDPAMNEKQGFRVSFADPRIEINHILYQDFWERDYQPPIADLELKEDIDDEAIHSRNRQRKSKARTNSR